ncbi:ATP-binding protein [Candidatus Magnetaquiglobus chichijimensis]|uniref:ATP-binding protein n=1 Tax=Candidatus Magnetaquiglobus chichijimensis TaxID=3141448 RepID=UPI003B96D357
MSLVLVAGYLLARQITWTSSVHLHTLLETVATTLAFMVGVLALMRHHTEKEDLYLLIGAGFLGTALLDLYHTIVTSAPFTQAMALDYTTLIPWSWFSSRFFLAFFLVLSWFFTRHDTRIHPSRLNPRWVLRGMGLFTLANLLFFMLMPLPRAIHPEWFVPRPQEWVPASLFLIALIGFLNKGNWRDNTFEHWLVLALLVNFWGEALFMATSDQLYDERFDLGHFFKQISYLCVLIGLLISILVVSFDLKQARQEAETANRSKSAFLANMSHEIRTPMNGVLGMIELALNVAISPTTREYLFKAQASSLTLLRLINDILDFSKIEQGALVLEKIPFRLPDLLADVADLFAPNIADKDLRLDIITPARKIEWLIGDPLRLQQVLFNLVGNAVKFTPRGRITVSVAALGRTAGKEQIQFRVMDEGIGIPLEKQSALFAPFTQADESTTRRFGGTGLGLAICKRLVEMMEGEIWVRSAPGRGSTFHFTVLLEIGQPSGEACSTRAVTAHRRAPLSRDALVNHLGGARVLLVEDQPINRQVAEAMLSGVGLIVECADNGQMALDKLEQDSFDLVLMDIQMPIMDGLSATRALRADARWRELPVLAMSAHAMHEDRLESLNAGMNEHVTKPIDSAQLFALLTRWIAPQSQRISAPAMKEATHGGHSFEGLTCIEVEELLDRVNHNQQLARMLLKEFVRGQEQSIPRLRSWLESGDPEDGTRAMRLVHSLKGMAGNLSARRVFESARALEMVLRAGAVSTAWSLLLDDLERALDQLVAEVRAWERSETAAGVMVEAQGFDARTVGELLRQLKPMLIQQDFDACVLFERLKPMLEAGLTSEKDYSNLIRELGGCLDQLDFQEARQVLHRLVGVIGLEMAQDESGDG